MLLVGIGLGCAGPSRGSSKPVPNIESADSAAVSARWKLPAAAEDPLHRSFSVSLTQEEKGSLISEVIRDGAEFTEALPSWNVPSGEPFIVDIRAQTAEGSGTWSPWLRIGDWAVPTREKDTPTQFSRGKVAVDIFKLSAPYVAAQLRFERPGGTLRPSEVKASMVLSDMRSLDETLSLAAAEEWPVTPLLRVGARSQRTVGDDIGSRICSPTSVSMVAAFHGANLPTRKMAEALLDPHYDIYGNWNRAVQGPATFGVPGRLVRVSSWATVADYLDRGLPIVASIRAEAGELPGAPYEQTAGHLAVVTGLSPGGAVHVNDPAASLPLDVPRVYQRPDFERVWFANGGVGYVFGPQIVDPMESVQ